jgi:hypothetical protein
VIPASAVDQRVVGVVEVEISGELFWRRVAGVAAVAPLLLVSEELDRHDLRA